MPNSFRSARAAISRPRAYKQGASPGRANATARAKMLHTADGPLPEVLSAGPRNPHRFAAAGKTQHIQWANDSQRDAFNYGPYPLLCSGGFGAGKTWALCLKAMYLSDAYPGNRGLIARLQGNKLTTTTMKTFFKVCPPEAYAFGSRSDQKKSLVLNNGSEILWTQLDDSEIIELLRGLEINWFLIDQAEEVSEEVVETLMRRLGRWDQAVVPDHLLKQREATGKPWPWYNERTGRPLPPTYAMLACNPDHELHWLYRRFHPESREWQETYSKQGYRMINFDSTTNLFLPKQNRDLLLQGTEEFIDRFVRGNWGISAGQIHNVTQMSLLKWNKELENYIFTQCKLSRTLDHGESSPTACLWFALDKWGNIICYREYYQPDRIISYHRERLYDLSMRPGNVKPGEPEVLIPEHYSTELADPSIFNARTLRGISLSVADEYAEINETKSNAATAIYWLRGDNNELATRNRINEFLRLDPEHRHPITRELGAPRLYFVERTSDYPNGCYEAIRETRSQRRVRIGTKDGNDVFSDDRDPSVPDHAYDCLRYRIADADTLPVEAIRRPGPGTLGHAISEIKRVDRRKRLRADGTARIGDLRTMPPKLAAFFKANQRRRRV